MITVDRRIGSKELLPLFPPGTAQLGTLTYGDFAFVGNGPEGNPISIGIERKKVREIAGTFSDKRFVGHQLPGLQASYGVVYLIIEGSRKMLEDGRSKVTRRAFDGFLNTLDIMAGCHLRFTGNRIETSEVILHLYRWWTSNEWDEHTSLQAFYCPPPYVMLYEPSLLRRMAKELPGIGWKKSEKVEGAFGTVAEMVMAGEKEWRGIEGVGKTLAERITKAIWIDDRSIRGK